MQCIAPCFLLQKVVTKKDRMAKASSMWWYGHVMRKEDENVIVKALKFEVSGTVRWGYFARLGNFAHFLKKCYEL